jgi:DNA primase
MSDLQELKRKIYEEDKVAQLLEELGCENIHLEQNGRLLVARLPNGDNNRSIQIKMNEHLTTDIRTRNINGDIFSLVGYIEFGYTTFEEIKENLYQIKVFVCNVLKYKDFLKRNQKKEESRNWNEWLKKIKRKSNRTNYEFQENEPIPKETMDQYLPFGHWLFYDEGINFRTQYEFGVRFDKVSERIVFPVRNRHGQLIGVKGRYAGNDKEIMDNAKYLYIYACDKSLELYNLDRALPYIKEKNEVIVVEGAKTVWLLAQWGCRNVVSIEGSSLTPVQAMLLKELDVDIVFAFDKDVEMENIMKVTRQIKSRLLTVIYDKDNLLGPKDSPTDKGRYVWTWLYRNCRQTIRFAS